MKVLDKISDIANFRTAYNTYLTAFGLTTFA